MQKPALARAVVASALALPVAASCSSTPESDAPPVERAEVKTLEFRAVIDAPVEVVWDTMLGREGYERWTAVFTEGSTFEGSWEEGEGIHFLAPDGNGMAAVIAENRLHELVRIEHRGFVADGVEDTTSDAVRSWAPAYETYRFRSVPGGTEVTVEQDVLAGSEASMEAAWQKALAELARLCEEAG